MMASAVPDPWSCVRGLQPLSLCDWPGKVCLVLFLGGCNLRCPTCHNAQLAWRPETLPRITREVVVSYCTTRGAWLDGIVISGGEPSCVPGLEELCTDLAGIGLPLKLDSNGLRPYILNTLLAKGLLQAVAVDVKGPWEKYPALTGGRCSPDEARSALQLLFDRALQGEVEWFFRCTRVPALSGDDIQKVRSALPAGHELTVQDFVPPAAQAAI